MNSYNANDYRSGDIVVDSREHNRNYGYFLISETSIGRWNALAFDFVSGNISKTIYYPGKHCKIIASN